MADLISFQFHTVTLPFYSTYSKVQKYGEFQDKLKILFYLHFSFWSPRTPTKASSKWPLVSPNQGLDGREFIYFAFFFYF